ncbi:hypothetical protein [Peribacillus sp. NPDC058075]|uniref:hypothetical protein n=1 Tax=unclassified Peribacillus TaxID=2675266 RepID=UPI0036DF8F50
MSGRLLFKVICGKTCCDAVDTVNEFVRVIHLKRYLAPVMWHSIGQGFYEECDPVVNMVPIDYIIQAAASLALYKEG